MVSTAPAALLAQKTERCPSCGFLYMFISKACLQCWRTKERTPSPSSSILFSLRVRGDEKGPGSPPPSTLLPTPPPPSIGPWSSLPPLPQSSPGNLTSTQGSTAQPAPIAPKLPCPWTAYSSSPATRHFSNCMPLSPTHLKPNLASDPFPATTTLDIPSLKSQAKSHSPGHAS